MSNKSKTLSVITFFVVLLVLSSFFSQVLAVQLLVYPDGSVHQVKGWVLGKDDQENQEPKSSSSTSSDNPQINIPHNEDLRIKVSQEKNEVKVNFVEKNKGKKELEQQFEQKKKSFEKRLENATEDQKKSIEQEKNTLEHNQEESFKKLEDKDIKEVKDGEFFLKFKDSSGSAIRSRENKMEVEIEGEKIKSTPPITVNPNTGQFSVDIAGKEVPISQSPKSAIEELQKQGLENRGIELSTQSGKAIFTIDGAKSEKLFGLFPVEITKKVQVDASTGQTIKTNQSFLNQFFDLFSF